jgi:hypothetical protein
MAMQLVLVIRMTGLGIEAIEQVLLERIAVESLRMECRNRLRRRQHRLLVMAIARTS